MLNIIYLLETGAHRFDFLLAFVALVTWIKTIFLFRITQSFGPLFKIILKMGYDLAKFLVIWSMVLMAFSCITLLMFGSFPTFYSITSTFLFYF